MKPLMARRGEMMLRFDVEDQTVKAGIPAGPDFKGPEIFSRRPWRCRCGPSDIVVSAWRDWHQHHQAADDASVMRRAG
jgi:hypothetical protein